MNSTYTQIERMITGHIEDIDTRIGQVLGADTHAELYKAKSLALQALVDLKNEKDGK